MLLALILAPLALALLAFALPSERWRPWLLPFGAVVHLVLLAFAPSVPHFAALGGWLKIDPLGRVALIFLSLLFFGCALYAPGYLRLWPGRSNRVFVAALFAFLSMMTLATEAQHLGLMWVAIEACTLSSAPLLYFNHNTRSLEATWKYMLLGSVGIALALLGSFFLAYSALRSGLSTSLFFGDLVKEAPLLSKPWLHVAFSVLFVGYGTKMGLAPMHTWKPDAYGEAPGLVGALLAGGLTTCAFVAILRFFQICGAAGEAAFAQELMVVVGLFSMAVAAVFMARQRDFKRMLAYSSVEHMGILVLGMGIGGAGVFGSLLHLVNNGMTKGVLFLSAANIHRAYSSKVIDEVGGVLRRLPATGVLFLAGFFAITGSPPFGPFFSELTILRAALGGDRFVVGALFLAILLIIFLGMGATVMAVLRGEPTPKASSAPFKEDLFTVGPIIAFLSVVLLLGIYIPAPVQRLLENAAAFVGNKP